MPSITVTLGDTEFTVPPLNIGQLEQVTEALTGPPVRATFAILRIALTRATPLVAPQTIEATRDQVAAAVDAILKNSGFKAEPKADDPNGEPPAEGAG